MTQWTGNFGGSLSPDWRVAPFIAMKTADGAMVPWLASQGDIMADDWFVTPEAMTQAAA